MDGIEQPLHHHNGKTMNALTQHLQKKLIDRDNQINELKGRLDASQGLPAASEDAFYLSGYSEQYAQEQILTARTETVLF